MRILHQMLKTSSVNFGYVLSLVQMNSNEVERRINMTLQFHGKEMSADHSAKLQQILDKVAAHAPDMIQLHDVAIDNLEYLRLSGKSEEKPVDTEFFWLDLDEHDALDPFVDQQPAPKKRGRPAKSAAKKVVEDDEDDEEEEDEEEEIAPPKKGAKAAAKPVAKKKPSVEEEEEDEYEEEDDEEEEVVKPKKGAKPVAKKKPASIDDESEEDWG
jgi:hypothetical protein